MKKNIVTLMALLPFMHVSFLSADFFSAMLKEQAEHMQRMASAMQQFEEDVHKRIKDAENGEHVTVQSVKYSFNKLDNAVELILDGLKADSLRSHFDRAKNEFQLSSESQNGNATVRLGLKSCYKQLVLVGTILQSVEVKKDEKNEKEEPVCSQMMHAESSNGFAEQIDKLVNLEEACVNYNKEKAQLRIKLPLVAEANDNKDIPVTME